MNPTPTPRVDAAIERWKNKPWAGSPTDRPLMLARELERELTEQAKRFHDEIADRQKTEAANRELNLKERDRLCAELAEAKDRIKSLEAGRDGDFEIFHAIRLKLTEACGDPYKLHQEALDAIIAERDQLRAECERLGRLIDGIAEAGGDEGASARMATETVHLRAEVEQIRNTLQDGLDRDKDDTTTPHLAVVAVNALAQLRARVESLSKPWSVSLIVPTASDPFNQEPCEVVDIGHADHILVVKCALVTELESQGAAQAFVDMSVRAEVERLHKMVADAQLSAKVALARVAELEADKARLDWVLAQFTASFLPGNQCWAWNFNHYFDLPSVAGQPCRKAIDAARGKGAI